ncbi:MULTISPECIES: hypothetical protein [Okeania]|uniref:Uncharacterized protein n=1 Tax=Okeania hirsuta TaxID=1458930 RepID=A0A3N6RSL4_9CYAN|nr:MULTISPECIES: hypothetical protein [Okeania]NET12358.1 hypothetical protein [Okeania sp. SIO1H6]NES75431.1 hypothetical protein [Okeania sp. SIO1H4]NES89287.1 hypothetical protein [Okeania sp. SIO2B9]NET17853.1 hypothetical protein [Okeania sp. SIO1H5]NET77325.1 hypothetical protein [Okeania sp. SIO1F9]
MTIENFIIRNLYEFCSIYLEYARDASLVEYSVAHDETRSCLFDMCGNKADTEFDHCILKSHSKNRSKHSPVKHQSRLYTVTGSEKIALTTLAWAFCDFSWGEVQFYPNHQGCP